MPDNGSELQLNERARHLLKVLVEAYIQSGQPVGSRTLARVANLDLSSATVRNVMAELEEMDLVYAPHTSAGRVPTVAGYRLFIDTLIRLKPVEQAVLDQLKNQLHGGLTSENLMEAASTLLSGMTHLVGIVTLPRQEHTVLRRIEFVALSAKRVLVILVLNEQQVHNRVIELERRYTESELQAVANFLNHHYTGQDLSRVRQMLLHDLEHLRENVDRLMRAILEVSEKAFVQDQPAEEGFVLFGQTNLMDYAELSDIDKLRQLFAAFTHKRDILHVLDRCISAQGVQIFVGRESGYQVLDECSVVSAPYQAHTEVIGVLGVIGPKRMPYDRIIPVVDLTARLLGAALKSDD